MRPPSSSGFSGRWGDSRMNVYLFPIQHSFLTVPARFFVVACQLATVVSTFAVDSKHEVRDRVTQV